MTERLFIMGFSDELYALVQALQPEQAIVPGDMDTDVEEELLLCLWDYVTALFEDRSLQLRRDIIAEICKHGMVSLDEVVRIDDLMSTLVLNKMQNNIPGFKDITKAKLLNLNPTTGSFLFTVRT
jgi:hypothetical protein